MSEQTQYALELARAIRADAPTLYESKARVDSISPHDQIVYFSLVQGTEDYIENLVLQINGCYVNEWYDACMVMLRRLIEVLIIETFEAYDSIGEIKTKRGFFKPLYYLIDDVTTAEKWTVDPNAAMSLDELRQLGNIGAHGRRLSVIYEDVQGVRPDVRKVVQELVRIVKSTGRWR